MPELSMHVRFSLEIPGPGRPPGIVAVLRKRLACMHVHHTCRASTPYLTRIMIHYSRSTIPVRFDNALLASLAEIGHTDSRDPCTKRSDAPFQPTVGHCALVSAPSPFAFACQRNSQSSRGLVSACHSRSRAGIEETVGGARGHPRLNHLPTSLPQIDAT
jgi:hypothetical protein